MKKDFSASKFFLKVATLIVIFLVVIFAAPLALNINAVSYTHLRAHET